MVILHYFLGFPPYRSGGLTRYCMDLMETQKNKGDKVIALWPGQISFISKEIHIKKRKNIKNIKLTENRQKTEDEKDEVGGQIQGSDVTDQEECRGSNRVFCFLHVKIFIKISEHLQKSMKNSRMFFRGYGMQKNCCRRYHGLGDRKEHSA